MCEVGDIILIEDPKVNNKDIGKHSFIVLSTEKSQIQGLDYDIACNIMESFHNEDHRKKKLSYPGNFEIKMGDSVVDNGNNKTGCVVTEQFFFFNSEKTKYKVIGRLNEDVFDKIIDFISSYGEGQTNILENL